MNTIDTLRKRLKGNRLVVQNEDGFVSEVAFEWNEPTTEEEIRIFEKQHSIMLPRSYREFLKISNGAVLFKDIEYGQWGCRILGLSELHSTTLDMKTWGCELPSSFLVFATWLGDLDVLLFDLKRLETNEKSYIIDGEQGVKVEEWSVINGDFSKWLDRLVIAQGTKYWRWY